MPSTWELFNSQRQHVIEKLRSREPDLIRELEAIDLTLKSLGSGPPVNHVYAGYKSAIDAIVAYLRQIKRTEEKEVVAQAIVDGGWLLGNRRGLINARASVKFHLDRSASTKYLKRFPSGRIGLYEWTKDYDRD